MQPVEDPEPGHPNAARREPRQKWPTATAAARAPQSRAGRAPCTRRDGRPFILSRGNGSVSLGGTLDPAHPRRAWVHRSPAACRGVPLPPLAGPGPGRGSPPSTEDLRHDTEAARCFWQAGHLVPCPRSRWRRKCRIKRERCFLRRQRAGR